MGIEVGFTSPHPSKDSLESLPRISAVGLCLTILPGTAGRVQALRRLGRSGRRCDNLESAVLNELVAQLVEQRPFKAWVLGSSPSELTTLSGRDSPFNSPSTPFAAGLPCRLLFPMQRSLSMDSAKVAEYWESNAETWTRLVRAGYDIYRDALNTPAFLAMLPPVSGLCGLNSR